MCRILNLVVLSLCLAPQLFAEMHLYDYLKPFRKEIYEKDARKARIALSELPEINEKTRTLTWRKKFINKIKTPYLVWDRQVVFNDQLRTEGELWSYYIYRHFEGHNPHNRAHSDKMLKQQQKADQIITEAVSEDVSARLKLVMSYSGYEENDENGEYEKYTKEGQIVQFGAYEFEVQKGEEISLLSPKIAKGQKSVLIRVQRVKGNFSIDYAPYSTRITFSWHTLDGLNLEDGKVAKDNDFGGVEYVERAPLRGYKVNGATFVQTNTLEDAISSYTMNSSQRKHKVYLHKITNDGQVNCQPNKFSYGGRNFITKLGNREILSLNDVKQFIERNHKVGQSVDIHYFSAPKWERTNTTLGPDYKAIAEAEKLRLIQFRKEEKIRQEIITLHEKERAKMKADLIKLESSAKIREIESQIGVQREIRRQAQQFLLRNVKSYAREDPHFGIMFLKYIADTSPQLLTKQQQKKLSDVVWIDCDLYVNSPSHIDMRRYEKVEAYKQSVIDELDGKNVKMTEWNTAPTLSSLIKGEMLYLGVKNTWNAYQGETFLPIDNSKVFLEFLLDDLHPELSFGDQLAVSECGLCLLDASYYLPDRRDEYNLITYSKIQNSVQDYFYFIKPVNREYNTYKIPKPKRRTFSGLMIKSFIAMNVTRVGYRTLMEGAGLDADKALNEIKANMEGKKAKEKTQSTRIAKSNWTGKRKGEVHIWKGSDSREYRLIYQDGMSRSSSISWAAEGWRLDSSSYHLKSFKRGRYFKSKDALLAEIRRCMP